MIAVQRSRRRLLVVEDNDADVELLREALADVVPSHDMDTCVDGHSALRHLDEVAAGSAPAPELVVLDLNLPGPSGFEILERVKQDPALKRLPVVVLTTSDSAVDIDRCYRMHANSYVVKATNFADFVRDVDAIVQFWLDTVASPVLPTAN